MPRLIEGESEHDDQVDEHRHVKGNVFACGDVRHQRQALDLSQSILPLHLVVQVVCAREKPRDLGAYEMFLQSQ